MTSIIKVDQIQTAAGGVPTAGDLGLNTSGNVVAVYNSISTLQNQTISTAGLVNIAGLSITMTPKNANNLLVMEAVIQNTKTYVCSYAFLKDGALTAPATNSANNSISNVQLTSYLGFATTQQGYVDNTPLMHYENAVNTSQRTYTVACTSTWSGTGQTMRVNNRDSNDMSAYSYFRITEIAG